jgi:hypothetical protein
MLSDGTMCWKHDTQEAQTYCVKNTHTQSSGTQSSEQEDQLEQLHKAAHANCGQNPCPACRMHESTEHEQERKTETEDRQPVKDMQASTAKAPMLHPEMIRSVYDNMMTDTQPTWTTTGRAVHVAPDVESMQHKFQEHTLNDAGICKACRRHWNSCQCPPTETAKHAHAQREPISPPEQTTGTHSLPDHSTTSASRHFSTSKVNRQTGTPPHTDTQASSPNEMEVVSSSYGCTQISWRFPYGR